MVRILKDTANCRILAEYDKGGRPRVSVICYYYEEMLLWDDSGSSHIVGQIVEEDGKEILKIPIDGIVE